MAKIRTEPRFKLPLMWRRIVRTRHSASSETTENDTKFVATDASNLIFHSDNDDLLSVILAQIDQKYDKKSVSMVCKQWLRIEGMTHKTIRVFEPILLHNLVRRFPNVVKFYCSVRLTNENIELVAKSYPKLQVLDLSRHGISRLGNVLRRLKPDDDGLFSVLKHSTKLSKVGLRWRLNVSDMGVISLLNSAKYLVELDLGGTTRVTNETFAVTGSNCSLKVLNLGRSSQITLEGFKLLANGAALSKTLVKLVLNSCNGAGDDWCPHMRKFLSLEELPHMRKFLSLEEQL